MVSSSVRTTNRLHYIVHLNILLQTTMAEDGHASLSPPSPQPRSLEDPGAHDLDSDSDEQHFSDARSDKGSPSRTASPIPITRVEKVDHEASYGEVPGTDAYEKRTEDARPDEVAFVEEDEGMLQPATTQADKSIPKTVLEEIPPSPARSRRNTIQKLHPVDAQPDVVLQIPDSGSASPTTDSAGGLPLPTTKVEKVDSEPSPEEVPGTDVYEKGTADAIPNAVEKVEEIAESPTSSVHRSLRIVSTEPSSFTAHICAGVYEEDVNRDQAGFGDDFDEFEEGDEDAEFGDFDDGFDLADTAPASAAPVESLPNLIHSLPVLNCETLDSPSDFELAAQLYVDALFPSDSIDTSVVPAAAPEMSNFLTQRSASLWSQLVAPPPLQPPNWIRSRIRRLFLVSLGVPVDLDEILPASKQKKLILPSTISSGRTSTDSRVLGSVTRLKAGNGNGSNTSIDSSGKPTASKRRRGPPPPPELDLVFARQLCTVTDEALAGLTNAELEEHVRKLESMQNTAGEVLEYWTKRTDEKLGDREAFEGVIENLVQHARKVRK